LIAVFAGLSAASTGFGASALPATDAVSLMTRYDGHVQSIGYKLAAAATPYCDGGVFLPGFSVHTLSQYSATARPAALAVFGFSDSAPQIRNIATDSPAAAAGLVAGDAIVAIDDAPLPIMAIADGAAGDFAYSEAVLSSLERAAALGTLTLKIRRQRKVATIRVALQRGCYARFDARFSRGLSAQADGQWVQVSTGLLDYARDDTGVAAVLSHELAHNILGHRRARQSRKGVSQAAGEPSEGRLRRNSELAADQLGVAIMACAGFAPEGALAFWQRIARERPWHALGSADHPGARHRIAAIESALAGNGVARASCGPVGQTTGVTGPSARDTQ
jgi:hypothetical protein